MVERFLGKKEVMGSIPIFGLFENLNLPILINMAKKAFVKLKCQECKRVNYFTHKPKKSTEKKLELKKFCKWCRKHTIHKEAKR